MNPNKIILDWKQDDLGVPVRTNLHGAIVAAINGWTNQFFPKIYHINLGCEDEALRITAMYSDVFPNNPFATIEEAKDFVDRWLKKAGCIFPSHKTHDLAQ